MTVWVLRNTEATTSDEPLYEPGVSTLVYAGDASESYYASFAATYGEPLGADMRLVPSSSPVDPEPGNGPPDTSKINLTTGKGGTGKALQLMYPAPTYQTGEKWWLVNTPSIAAGEELVVRWQKRYTGSMSGTWAYKHFHVYLFDVPGGGVPQWNTHDVTPASSTSGKSTFFQYYDNGYTDGTAPTGNQGTQPFGPYTEDMFDSAWRRFTVSYKAHASSGNRNGHARMWIDGVKVIDVSQAAVGVTPDGGEKPWCSQNHVDNMIVNTAFNSGSSGLLFWGGACTTTVTGTPGEDINIGDGDPENLDTLAVWRV